MRDFNHGRNCSDMVAGLIPKRRNSMIYGYFYRALMRFAHRFDWHYAPIHGPISGGERPYLRWCQWCGLRESGGTDS